MRITNADLKEDNRNLIDALKATQDNFRKEFSNMKVCERRMREQQDALSKMQSTISIKTANTARLLERIQDYEKMVTKMNFERNLAKRENRFFRAIIGKLQRSKNECFTIEKEEIYKQYGHEYDEKPVDCNKNYETNYYDMLKARGDFHAEYLLKQKLCVNYSNTSTKYNKVEKCERDMPESSALVKNCYMHDGCSPHRRQYQHHQCGIGSGSSRYSIGVGDGTNIACDELECSDHEPGFPIRYTISDASMFAGCGECGGGVPCTSRSNSCTSLQANFSTCSVFGSCREGSPPPPNRREYATQPKKKHHQLSNVDGIRFVYSKFGNFQ
ncbi:uncharacterized protein [Eurosta solidaginis]|uniref:uncharacterized protein n=1 Tax=Eurosta solidaginis TaxID=178769 RepID=UPI0035314A2B